MTCPICQLKECIKLKYDYYVKYALNYYYESYGNNYFAEALKNKHLLFFINFSVIT